MGIIVWLRDAKDNIIAIKEMEKYLDNPDTSKSTDDIIDYMDYLIANY